MWLYIKRYPFSLLFVLAVLCLSFLQFPQTDINLSSGFDKLAHFCMYFGLSGMLWLEFWRVHRHGNAPLWHAWVGAFLCPVLFSGGIELMQEWFTPHRGGEWLDLVANCCGATVASLSASWLLVCYRQRS